MEIFKNLNDDQLALLGCAGALFVTGVMMSLSHFIGRARKRAAEPLTAVVPAPHFTELSIRQPVVVAEAERNAA
jgi:hypothetical protein